jgi:HSP20 family molecular chaperone IbpA
MSSDLTTAMWVEACRLLDRAERLRRQFFAPLRSGQHLPSWEPPIDVFESGTELIVWVALPGIEPSDVRVSIESGSLTVRARRGLSLRPAGARIRRLEIPYGHFERCVMLPAGTYAVKAHRARHGCLELRLHKAEG